MNVKDFFSKMVDNYQKVVVEVFDPATLSIKTRHTIEPHATYFDKIPVNIWEMEVEMVVLYNDGLAISVRERRS